MPTREDFRRRWMAGAHRGVNAGMDYREHRRVLLANQMAMLGALITVLYALLASLYDVAVLWPLLAAAPPLLCGYASVLWLDHRRRFLTARVVLVVVPTVQITFAVWLFGNNAGIQLHFFALWTALFLLYAPEDRWLAVAAGLLWIGLYTWIRLGFDDPVLPLRDLQGQLGLRFLHLAFLVSMISSFALVGAAVALFYAEIRRTGLKLQDEYQRSEALLDSILPASVARRLKDGDTAVAEHVGEATLLFADLVGFTGLARNLPPAAVVALLDRVFSRFDGIVQDHGLEKIKTIGDEYMLAGGLPLERPDHARAVACAALDMQTAFAELNSRWDHDLDLRVGIHTGEVVAGVIGSHKFSYDVWGDTVNTASRMQSRGVPGHIQVSEATAAHLQQGFTLERRGVIQVPGKGDMPTWFLTGRASS